MENLPESTKPAPPIQITEDIQVSLNRLGRDLETHAESGIRIGKELIYLKEITPHGGFEKLVEWAYGLTSRQCRNYMQVAENFGNQNGNRFPFSNTVLIELSKPSTPDSAKKEAEEHKKLTVKQAKELTKANKLIGTLQAKIDNPPAPDLENLIPEISKLFRGGSVVLARAEQLSTLDHKYQNIYLQEFHSKEFHRKAADRAKAEAADSMSKALKAIEEKELAMAKVAEVTGVTDSDLIFKHDKELTELRTGYLEMLKEEKDKAQKQASELHAKLNKEKIEAAYKDKDAAEKAKKQAQEKANAAYGKREELEGDIKRLQDQLEVNNPDNVDMAMAKQMRSSGTVMLSNMKELRLEMLKMGGGMERSIEVVKEIMEIVSLKLSEIKRDVGETITIE